MSTHPVPKGYLFNGIHCGLKRKRRDLSLIFSEKPFKVAAMFTKNTVKAAPVLDAQKKLADRSLFNAVLVNSGNANCLTGDKGLGDCRRMAALLGRELSISADSVLVSSTGVIGRLMDLSPLDKGIPDLVRGLDRGALENAAKGIMTTDSFPKMSSRTVRMGGTEVVLTAVAKGAGMIKPDMATMLAYVMTDAAVGLTFMRKALRHASDESFNRITVDGEMSTNDTVLLLANGAAGNRSISASPEEQRKFQDALSGVCHELAEMIVLDGEGANKFMEVVVSGARTRIKAERIAGAIADSLLVKCAVLGEDPNWGRVASSAGSTGEAFDTNRIEIALDGIVFYRGGRPVTVSEKVSGKVFKGRRVRVEMDLNEGDKEARRYSCDISKRYINLNAHYTT